MKVLIADDDLACRLLLQATVEQLGHECLVAVDGNQAWALYLDHQPDVLVTDQMMPGVAGLELCRRIRADTNGIYTFVILVTARDERADVLAGMAAGADDYLAKPLDPFALQTRLMAASRVTALHTELNRYRCELTELACTDPLTRLRNRHSLDEDIAALHARGQRYGRPYAVAMCDVDYFKPFNDGLGHQAGDAALRAVADALFAEVRSGDVVYRYGGEEFLAILPEQDLESGVLAANRYRRSVEALCLPHPASPVSAVVTISVGVAAYEPGRAQSIDELLQATDDSLYRAKSEGRNRVVAAPPSETLPGQGMVVSPIGSPHQIVRATVPVGIGSPG